MIDQALAESVRKWMDSRYVEIVALIAATVVATTALTGESAFCNHI
jgi:hypothetical protein